MSNEQMEKVIELLFEKIGKMESEIFLKDYENEKLTKEVARLNELLTPTKKLNED